MEPNLSPYMENFQTIRMVVLFEVDPVSDHYHQIMFTEDQLKKVQKFISAEILKEDKDGNFSIPAADNVCVHLPNSRDHYSQEEIDN